MRCLLTLGVLIAWATVAHAQPLPYPTASDWTQSRHSIVIVSLKNMASARSTRSTFETLPDLPAIDSAVLHGARIDPNAMAKIDYSLTPFIQMSKNPFPDRDGPPVVLQPYEDKSKLLIAGLLHDDEVEVKKTLAELKRLNIDASAVLRKLACNTTRSPEIRLTAFEQIMQSTERLNASRVLLQQDSASDKLRVKALTELGQTAKLLDLISIKDSMISVKDNSRLPFARALALTRDGSELLLAAIAANGKLAAVLRDDEVLKNLKAAKVRDLDERLKTLAK